MRRHIEWKPVKGAAADPFEGRLSPEKEKRSLRMNTFFLTIGLLTSLLGCTSLDGIKGTIHDEIYTAPDNSFVVEVPFPGEIQDEKGRYLRIHDKWNPDGTGTFNVTFGPAAYNRAFYRIMVEQREQVEKALGMRKLTDDEIRKVTLLAARRLVEEVYQAKTTIISEETLVHDGQTAQYTGLVQPGLKSYPGLSTSQEITLYHGVYIYIQKHRIVRFWVQDVSLTSGKTHESLFTERTYPRMQDVFDSLHVLPRH